MHWTQLTARERSRIKEMIERREVPEEGWALLQRMFQENEDARRAEAEREMPWTL